MSKALINKKNKENISKKILNIFKKTGFDFIDLDIVIDTDLLTRRSGEGFKKYALNFRDKSGKEISLRPDLTIATAIQYIQSKKTGTAKLSYFGRHRTTKEDRARDEESDGGERGGVAGEETGARAKRRRRSDGRAI